MTRFFRLALPSLNGSAAFLETTALLSHPPPPHLFVLQGRLADRYGVPPSDTTRRTRLSVA
jgi:hypothetical protein